jgi:hypothetical protein
MGMENKMLWRLSKNGCFKDVESCVCLEGYLEGKVPTKVAFCE